MSRCFRFPPPGYEKKIRIDETHVLAKENHEDKDSVQENRKDRKHKKDREKKDGKDRKEKKERKSKHKDKKDKKRDKGKNGTSDEKKCEKIGSNNSACSNIEDSKFVHELSRRISDDGRALQSQSFEKIENAGPRRVELPGRMVEKSNLYERKEEDMVKKEDDRKINGQRNHVYARGFEGTIVHNLSSMDRKKVVGFGISVGENGNETETEKIKRMETYSNGDKSCEDRNGAKKRKFNDKEKKNREEKTTREMSELRKDPSSPLPILNGVDNVKKRSNLSKTNGEFRGVVVAGNLGKRKELEKMNGYLHENGAGPNKLPRLVCAPPSPGKASKSEWIETNVYSTPQEVRNGNVDIKERRINGFNGVQRSGLHSASSLLALQANNGEAPGKPQHPAAPRLKSNLYSASAATSLRIPLHVKEEEASSKKKNSKGETLLPSSSSTRASHHPDSKYLNTILSVPKMDGFPDSDDQEWLFGGSKLLFGGSKLKKPKQDPLGVVSGVVVPQVWNQAIRMDSSDDDVLWALPYVIPF